MDFSNITETIPDLILQIDKIKNINKNNKLVIFVGAGVSKNSGVCSWWELVKEIADRINENKCKSCDIKNLVCTECGKNVEMCSVDNYNCKLKYNFSSDDFLIIPQHYFESLGDDKSEYYQLLREQFCKPIKSNIIDDIIVSLNPEHIITTNYDHLLEDTKVPNISKYTIIKSDHDILEKNGRNYIIKMHGDVDDLQNIVLKEDDYLKYSQNHILIESYIKALLIDKTFLFVGYSLSDNNLKLVMSYIDYFVKEKKITGRSPHYLAINKIENSERNIPYWRNKGVELIDLSKIDDNMINNSKCYSVSNYIGKQLYTLLYYIKNDDLKELSELSISKAKDNLKCFEFVRNKTLSKVYNHIECAEVNEPLFKVRDKFKGFYKKIEGKFGFFDQENEEQNLNNILFELSIQNKYTEIMRKLEDSPNTSRKAYYYSLIKYINGLDEVMDSIKKNMGDIDYLNITNQQYYDLAIYEFNNICFRQLTCLSKDLDCFERLDSLIDNAAVQYSEAYKTIRDIKDNNSEIQKMNDILLSHEEYYMEKSKMSKMCGTIYGDLFKIQNIAYDYYLFYKKNHLMLDLFSNVNKMVTPYIKAILCTYYPDEYQYSTSTTFLFGRTQVKPYFMNIIDIDMIVRHIKLKDLRTWISHYKVFTVKINIDIDIATLFEDFCISMKTFWNVQLIEQLKTFSLLLSLSEMSKEQNKQIVDALISLSTPDKTTNIGELTNNIFAIMTFVERHYDKEIESYTRLLELLINKEIIKYIDDNSEYIILVKKLSKSSNEEIYQKCCEIVEENNDKRQRSFLSYVYHPILLKYNENKWKSWILENIQDNRVGEIYEYLLDNVIDFNINLKNYYIDKFKEFDESEISKQIPYHDSKSYAINQLIILFLSKFIRKIEDIDFLKKYADTNEYLDFLFNPESFDYSKIKTADNIWCNFLNIDEFRDVIISHKAEFWTKDDEKRISLGFGSPFENKVTYKYLFD